MKFLTDPRIFNYLIMCLYVINAGRWAIAGSGPDTLYWIAAFLITLAVTLKTIGG